MNTQQQEETSGRQGNSSPTSTSSSLSQSISTVDEISSFGASKQNRLPALIKMNDQTTPQQTSELNNSIRQPNSMPAFTVEQLEKIASNSTSEKQSSLPMQVKLSENSQHGQEKENSGDFQIINMDSSDLMGPSLPQPQGVVAEKNQQLQQQPLGAIQVAQDQPSLLGDSLIEMIINLRNENQNLVRALETNNEYVKERLAEFKKVNEETKKKEAQFALEKAENEHQIRKLQRQNNVLSDRLKNMESKLKDMKLEVSDAIGAASSSKASSIRGENSVYPDLNEMQLNSSSSSGSSSEGALEVGQAPTMQIDATSGELLNDTDSQVAQQVGSMTKEQLSQRFDAQKEVNEVDPMTQCDRLERQLNEIGKKDYEICLLQQQLNIYRQDYRLERMATLEAKLQIEKLKADIDRLCYERLQREAPQPQPTLTGSSHRPGVHFSAEPALAAASSAVGRIGGHLGRKAARSAAKAARYAAKQAHREERAAMAAAAAAAANTGVPTSSGQPGDHQHHHHHHHRRHHRSEAYRQLRGVGSEVVNDLLSTANKAMLTGYKMASTHVNLALDKLSQYEQSQASQLSQPRTTSGAHSSVAKQANPSAPSMEPPSMD